MKEGAQHNHHRLRSLIDRQRGVVHTRAELVKVDAVRVYCPCGATSLLLREGDIARAKARRTIPVTCPKCKEQMRAFIGNTPAGEGPVRYDGLKVASSEVLASDEIKSTTSAKASARGQTQCSTKTRR
jgi:hypothetical protein